MDSNAYEDSKSSSEDDDRSEQGCDDHVGTGRSYECVFCKRGFTTAQALGGHMNIHRKDKAKKTPSSVIPSNSEEVGETYASFKSYMPLQNYPSADHFSTPSSEMGVNYQTYFPSDERSMHTNHSNAFHTYGNHPQHLNLYGDDVWRGNLGLTVGQSRVSEDLNEEREEASEEEDKLDLELRLGYDP